MTGRLPFVGVAVLWRVGEGGEARVTRGQTMSDQTTSSDAIIAEQSERLRQAHEAEAQRQLLEQPWVELRIARDGVSCWLESNGIVARRDTMEETSPAAAIPAIARLYKALTACDSLGRLAATPAGVEAEDRKAWKVAWDILRVAPDNASKAAELLGSIRRLPFVGDVVWWLCNGFKKVVEGNWHDGGLVRNIDIADGEPLPEESSHHSTKEAPLSDNDERVLMYLLEMHPRLRKQADIVAGARIARGTVGNALEGLRNAGLVCRPTGVRKGHGLTDEGKKLAELLRPKAPLAN